jgi:hypothetical protein
MLVTREILWNVEPCIDLLALGGRLHVYTNVCQKFNEKMKRRASLEVLKVVMKQLFISNRESLAELVLSLVVGHFDSPRTLHSTVQQLRDWY